MELVVTDLLRCSAQVRPIEVMERRAANVLGCSSRAVVKAVKRRSTNLLRRATQASRAVLEAGAADLCRRAIGESRRAEREPGQNQCGVNDRFHG